MTQSQSSTANNEHFQGFARMFESTHIEFGVPYLRAAHMASCIYLENEVLPLEDRIAILKVDIIEALRKAVLKKIAASKAVVS